MQVGRTADVPEARDGYTFSVDVTNTDDITLHNVYLQFKHRNHTCSGKNDLTASQRKYYFTCKTWSDAWYHDYWFGSFDANGRRYQTKSNFYCDLGKKDAGKPVETPINRSKMTVTPPAPPARAQCRSTRCADLGTHNPFEGREPPAGVAGASRVSARSGQAALRHTSPSAARRRVPPSVPPAALR
ncbi:hypothetical protein AB0I60_21645 [Actinosynnema sp. NPDC050436]|uniref:hypothetical protein n=1 Tax=Actinosynnema sp. NPDC050436 TaxID=3155659 RepID=UPI0033CAAE9F